MTTTSSFILILLARRISAAVSLCFSAMFMSGSLELMSIRSRSPLRSQREAVNVAPSRCCGEGGRSGLPERRFKDVDVLLNGAAASADAHDRRHPRARFRMQVQHCLLARVGVQRTGRGAHLRAEVLWLLPRGRMV